MYIGQRINHKEVNDMALTIREKIDNLIGETNECREDLIPTPLLSNIKKWKWGSYGWVSPASLIFTAAWRKAFYPEEDCCKIWARDEQNQAIPGSYSIRSADEGISIPLLAKHDLCPGFCSDNSGMQGSRAIEKMRSLKRLNTDFDIAQRTVFDLKLFAAILNQINELNSEQALEVIKFLVLIAKRIRERRIEQIAALQAGTSDGIDILSFLASTADPELTKCVTAACFDVIYGPHYCSISGVDDYKTAADARAQKPGDLSVMYGEEPRIAIEIKDKTQSIDWNNIERAKKILDANESIRNFIFILERRASTASPIILDMLSTPKFGLGQYDKISIVSLHDLFLLASSIATVESITRKTSECMALAPAIKPETMQKWLQAIVAE